LSEYLDLTHIRILDVLDILIVGYLIYLIYKLLRGSIAFNIFIGVLMLYGVWWIVRVLEMKLLTVFLGQFVSIGVILLIIIFQPEVRRFLLMLGNTTLKQRFNFINKFFDKEVIEDVNRQKEIKAIKLALQGMAHRKTGALLVMTKDLNHEAITETGVSVNADISQALLESIFTKGSPLHDGAVVIANKKIQAASCILPVSKNTTLPLQEGLRHRAGLGVTENFNAVTFIISEETGELSFASQGKLQRSITEKELESLLEEYY